MPNNIKQIFINSLTISTKWGCDPNTEQQLSNPHFSAYIVKCLYDFHETLQFFYNTILPNVKLDEISFLWS